MRQDSKRRLAQAELAMSTVDRANRGRELHLVHLRLSVDICANIRERLFLMG